MNSLAESIAREFADKICVCRDRLATGCIDHPEHVDVWTSTELARLKTVARTAAEVYERRRGNPFAGPIAKPIGAAKSAPPDDVLHWFALRIAQLVLLVTDTQRRADLAIVRALSDGSDKSDGFDKSDKSDK